MKKIGRRSFLYGSVKLGALLPALNIPSVLLARQAKQETAPLYTPSSIPDRVILMITADPSTSAAVNWRTDIDTSEGIVEYTVADAHPDFTGKVKRLKAKSRKFQFENLKACHHFVEINGLDPDTLYTYRVGQNESWSEWLQFKTAGRNDKKADLSFIYLGDAQVGIRPLWSRVIRRAYGAVPEAGLIIHAGDLVNRANKDDEWGDWFAAGSYIHSSVPAFVTPGNHEYTHEDGNPHLSVYWKQQFGVPGNGPAEDYLNGTCYFTDVQGVRFISLNTQMIEEALDESYIVHQKQWLRKVLGENREQWTCVVMHHPVFSTKKGRDNVKVREHLKPLFDQYQVDLVLQGHDHAYARGMQKISLTNGPDNQHSATMYVVSVSGSKMYETEQMEWADIVSGHIQLFHHIEVKDTVLTFKSFLPTGTLHDAFRLVKIKGQPNKLIEIKTNRI